MCTAALLFRCGDKKNERTKMMIIMWWRWLLLVMRMIMLFWLRLTDAQRPHGRKWRWRKREKKRRRTPSILFFSQESLTLILMRKDTVTKCISNNTLDASTNGLRSDHDHHRHHYSHHRIQNVNNDATKKDHLRKILHRVQFFCFSKWYMKNEDQTEEEMNVKQ